MEWYTHPPHTWCIKSSKTTTKYVHSQPSHVDFIHHNSWVTRIITHTKYMHSPISHMAFIHNNSSCTRILTHILNGFTHRKCPLYLEDIIMELLNSHLKSVNHTKGLKHTYSIDFCKGFDYISHRFSLTLRTYSIDCFKGFDCLSRRISFILRTYNNLFISRGDIKILLHNGLKWLYLNKVKHIWKFEKWGIEGTTLFNEEFREKMSLQKHWPHRV